LARLKLDANGLFTQEVQSATEVTSIHDGIKKSVTIWSPMTRKTLCSNASLEFDSPASTKMVAP
jgi:hypothetical protein